MGLRAQNLILAALAASCLHLAGAAWAADAIWTGLGSDDRWSNPANWSGGVLPTSADRVIKDESFQWWQTWPHSRQISVTIDGPAQAAEWSMLQFLYPTGLPFNQIYITPGADFQVGREVIDHEDTNENGLYLQTGGVHTVDEFLYLSGEFRMEGGTFVASTITATPDWGRFLLLGGHTQTAQLVVNEVNNPGLFRVGGTADVHITELFWYRWTGGSPQTDFSRPLYLDGADFRNHYLYENWPDTSAEPFNDMELVFDGGLADVALWEVGSYDYGSDDPTGWIGNGQIGVIEIGGDEPAHVRLVNNFDNFGWLTIEAPDPEPDAQYVDTLRITSGSVLDLNGLNLYVRTLDDRGGAFLNGQVVVVPEPAGAAFVLAASALSLRRNRRSYFG